VNDPWAPGALARIASASPATAVLIGTGLTMVDVALVLGDRTGVRMVAVSRSGLLPRGHLPGRVAPDSASGTPGPGASLPALVDAVLAESAAGGTRWHRMVDELRPITQELWQRLSLEQRADFLATRHRAWSVHRHRMAPDIASALERLVADGRLRCHGGSVHLAPGHAGTIDVRIGDGEPLAAQLVINCTGPGLDPRASREPLVRQLLDSGHVRAHPLGIGFDTDPDGHLRRRDGTAQARLWTLGPPRVGELYESLAVPEIGNQAGHVARAVVGALAAASPLAARSA
jgi:uncharacterized NAD(P)/FAD-binding protein YdhS